MSKNYQPNSIQWTLLLTIFWFSSSGFNVLLPPTLTNPSNCNLGLKIKDYSCNSSHFYPISVANAPGDSLGKNVYLKEVKLIINHEWAADLEITLISPNDAAVTLSTDNGSGQNNYGNPFDCTQVTTFISPNSPNACDLTSIINGSAPFIGQFLSEQGFQPIHDGTDPNDIWILQICDDGKEHEGTLEFVELVFEPTTCLNPTDVQVLNSDSTGVWLNWTSGSNCNETYFEIGPNGFSPGTNAQPGSLQSFVLTDTCPPVYLQGLSPSSSYDIYLREKCSAGFSINSCPVSFVTTCAPPVVTLQEDFNTQINCTSYCGFSCPINGVWQNSAIDDFDWIISDKNNITTNGTGPSDDNPGGGKYIYIESSQSLCRGGREGVLLSNTIEVRAGTDSCDMSYDYLLYGSHVKELRLEYRDTNSTQWNLIDKVEGDQGDAWVKRYLDLDSLHGQTVQFRFVGIGGNGPRADIALDNIIFYGSIDLGPPSTIFYHDNDMDGYGGQSTFYTGYFNEMPISDFVLNNTDCDDDNYFINPGVPETPCNGFDSNCNGLADEYTFAAPLVKDSTICSGVAIPFKATPQLGGQIYWSSDALGSDTLHVGNEYWLSNFPTNFSSSPIDLTAYALEVRNDSCFSSNRIPVTISVLPQANIVTTDSPEICAGTEYDLSNVDVIDNNGANGIISYHNSPIVNNTTLIDSIVKPELGQTFYIASTPVGGCTDIVAVDFNILPSPNAEIIGQENVCRNSEQTLLAVDNGNGVAPLIYSWNTGDDTTMLDVSSHPLLNGTDTYILNITGDNGCADADTLSVTTIVNMQQYIRTIDSVTTCGGSDGAIEITPLDGNAPYIFKWTNGAVTSGDTGILNNLSQSAHGVTITDNSPEQCELVIPLMTVNGPGAVVAKSESFDVSCNGMSDGAIWMNINGSNPIATWSNGVQNDSLFDLPAGQYTVTITDGPCENELIFEINEPSTITANPTIRMPDCNSGANGSISLNVFGGSPFYQFNWSNGHNGQTANGLSAGDYSVTVSDSKGCSEELLSLEVEEPAAIFYDTAAMFMPDCFNGSDGRLSIKPRGGTSPYDVDWSNGGMGTSITNLSSGLYTVSVEDANGCSSFFDIQLDQPWPIQINLEDKKDPDCKGIDNGHIFIATAGGTGNLNYTWNNNINTEDQTMLPDGDYWVSVTDAKGCELISDTISLQGPELMTVSDTITQPPCAGRNEGKICVIVNAQGNYHFDWSIDESGACINNLSPGEYTVTVTDTGSGCQIDTTFFLSNNQPLSLNIDNRAPECADIETGEIYLTPSGGTEPYQYLWGDTQDDSDHRTLLAAGNYRATVSDANGCLINTGDVFLHYPEPLSLDLLTFDQPTCYGDSTGIIEIASYGGTGDLNYLWSTDDTLTSINNIGEGLYTITVTDENDCSLDTAFQINWFDPIVLEEVRYRSGCNTLDSVCVTSTGGVGPYDYLWNHGDSATCLVDLPSGDYGVIVTDRVGCTEELMSIKIEDFVEPMFLQQIPSSDSICFGDQNGTVALAIEGGEAPYQYLWHTGVTGNTNDTVLTLQNLMPGGYWATITDADGCTSVSPIIEVIEAKPISSYYNILAEIDCHGYEDGNISINTQGGFPPFSFNWTNELGDTISQSEIANDLGAGVYFTHFIDAKNCEAQDSFILTQPSTPLSISTEIVGNDCFNDANAWISIAPNGGSEPYTYLWNTADTASTLTNLVAGDYQVEITDVNNCSIIDTFSIVDPPLLVLADFDINEPTCFGEENGSILVTMNGGTTPYTFDWEVSSQEDLMDIGADEYSLTVYDSTLMCTFDTTFVVGEPLPLESDSSSTPSIPGNAEGTATVIPSGGTSPYSYLWETGAITPTIIGLEPGWYTYLVTDNAGCQIEGGVMVDSLLNSIIDQEQVLKYSLYPNPTFGDVNLDLQLNSPVDFNIQIYNSIGERIKEEFIKKSSQINHQISLNDLPSGVYQFVIKNQDQILVTDRLVKF